MPFDMAAQVAENESLGGGYVLTTFHAPEIAALCEPGQFVMAGALDPTELLLRRPFSICLRGPGDDRTGGGPRTIGLLYRVVGRGTSFLASLKPGAEAALLGPLGRGFTLPRDGEIPVIAAGGVGIAAFPYFVETLVAHGTPPTLCYGGRTKDDLPMLDWLRERAARTFVTTDDGSAGEKGFVTAPLDRELATPGAQRRVYACGPHAMMRATAAVAAGRGTPCEVALETPMACGYGVCVGCVVEVKEYQGAYGRYRRACVDGPVMDASEIAW